MPNHTGPQIQIKDKRNPEIIRINNKADLLLGLSNRAYDLYDSVTVDDPRADQLYDEALLRKSHLDSFLQANKNLYTRYEDKNDPSQQWYEYRYEDHTENKHRVLSKPKGSSYAYGDYTGAPRAPHPQVFRRFGGNTRYTVYPFEKCGTKLTGLLDNKYDPKILQHPDSERASAHLLPHTARPIQAGASEVLRGVKQLTDGSRHWLFS